MWSNGERRDHVVLVGHGYWGKNIGRNLFEMGCLRGVCDPSAEAQAQVKTRYPGVRLYADLNEVLSDDEVRAVAISTPAETHAVLGVQALEAGRDVFVEKPLALTYEEGQQLVEAAEREGRVLMVGHLLEYHPAVVALEDLVRNGTLGKLQYVYSNRLNLGKFRREENILWSFAPHDIAVILRLVARDPIEVLTTGGAYLQPNVADTTITHLLFDDGLRAHVFVSWLHPYKEQRLVVVGSQKMAVFDDRNPPEEKLIVYDKGADWEENQPIPRAGEGIPVPYDHREPLRRELEHFVDCSANQKQPRTDGDSGLRVLRILQAAQQSLQMGGRRIPLYRSHLSET